MPKKIEFHDWMDKVDDAVDRQTGNEGMTTAELPDVDYWQMWDEGTSPTAAAKHAIKEAGSY